MPRCLLTAHTRSTHTRCLLRRVMGMVSKRHGKLSPLTSLTHMPGWPCRLSAVSPPAICCVNVCCLLPGWPCRLSDVSLCAVYCQGDLRGAHRAGSASGCCRLGFRVQGSGFRGWGLEFFQPCASLGFRVQGLGFRCGVEGWPSYVLPLAPLRSQQQPVSHMLTPKERQSLQACTPLGVLLLPRVSEGS